MRDPRSRQLLAERMGLPVERFVWLGQVHGTKVAVVDEYADVPRTILETDGVVTNLPRLALAILTADCVPVVAYDPRSGVIGAAHAGRVGAQQGVVRELMAAMVGLGAQPKWTSVFLGPSASGRKYEVPAQLQGEVEELLPGSACVTETGTPGLDLRAGLARQLEQLGVREVQASAECTIASDAYFSYRREKDTGRLATVIWMEQAG